MDEQIKRDFWNPEQLKAIKDQKFIAVGEVKWNRGELLEKIQEKKEELAIHIEPMNIRHISELMDDQLDVMSQYLDNMIRKMAEDNEMYIICELAQRYIEDEQHQRKTVHCEHCINKRAVQRKDGLVWRCPHRTSDVQMDGFCESGVRLDEDRSAIQ